MSEKRYCLLILYVIFCLHQILANEALDNLVRRKRVINLEPGGDVPLLNGDAPYVVNIRTSFRNVRICVGAILSRKTVITIASCVIPFDLSSIKVLAGSSYNQLGVEHNIITKNIHIANHQRGTDDGIALLTVQPAFEFNARIGSIQLHHGVLLPGMHATIFGWGHNLTEPYGTNHLSRLRSITVPIISHRDCVNVYRGHVVISDNDICTYDANKRCGHSDSGAPLVVNNQLAGLHLWRVDIPCSTSPDVFLSLQSFEYEPWIRNNIM